MNDWTLVYDTFAPSQEPLREALCTLGNGYFATRGAAPEAQADNTHYPGTYVAGGYDRILTDIAGRVVENEDLVNFPNWLIFTFRFDDGNWFNLNAVDILEYRQELNLRKGILHRVVRFSDKQGRVTRIVQRRFMHMFFQHLAGLETTLTAENWTGYAEVISALDGGVVNAGVDRYRMLNDKHLDAQDARGVDNDILLLKTQTRQSEIRVAEAARTHCFRRGERLAIAPSIVQTEDYVAHHFDLELKQGETVAFEKIVALYHSRDAGTSEPALESRQAVARAPRFNQLLESHTDVWNQLWRRFDFSLEGTSNKHEPTACILRLHLFHLLQTASPLTMDLDVGVPARGLHGEAYRGHVLWDELFAFPILNLRIPEITRGLLMYRYRRLEEARAAARTAGYSGAMFPWQSGSNGREESQRLHLNPRSGRWVPDNTHLQRHVNAAIVYNFWQYYQATHDLEFISFYGAEVILEIARFWSSVTTYNSQIGSYEIHGVMGPDEYHDAYPGAQAPGLSNNAYTNVMAAWVFCRALDVLDILPEDRCRELRELLDLRDDELTRWRDISGKMRICFHGDGIISQFEGYDTLKEFDWESYRKKYGDIHRLDRILEAEADSPNGYKVSKQADVLMLFYLFSAEELYEIFEKLGYPLHRESIPNNIEYYMRRTSHGSTLSNVVHSWVLSRVDRPRSWHLFQRALESDIEDIQGGTTPEGVHMGAMAGTVDLIQRCYTGIETRGDMLLFNPALPEELQSLTLALHYRGQSLVARFTHERLVVGLSHSGAKPIKICFRGEIHELKGEESREFRLAP